MAPSFKVLTLNCKGLNNYIKAKHLINHLTKEKPNILFLQETHQKKSSCTLLKLRWFEHQYLVPGSSKSRGVAIALSKGMQVRDVNCLNDDQGRYLFVNCKLDDKPFTLASIYDPNSGQLGFLSIVLERLAEFQTGELIIGVDINMVANPFVDRSQTRKSVPRIHKGKEYYSKVYNLLEKYGLVDIWHALYPSARQYTFPPHHS